MQILSVISRIIIKNTLNYFLSFGNLCAKYARNFVIFNLAQYLRIMIHAIIILWILGSSLVKLNRRKLKQKLQNRKDDQAKPKELPDLPRSAKQVLEDRQPYVFLL